MSQSAQERANIHYSAIREQMDAINRVTADLVMNDVDWTSVGSLYHIRAQMADLLEGWVGEKTYRDEENG